MSADDGGCSARVKVRLSIAEWSCFLGTHCTVRRSSVFPLSPGGLMLNDNAGSLLHSTSVTAPENTYFLCGRSCAEEKLCNRAQAANRIHKRVGFNMAPSFFRESLGCSRHIIAQFFRPVQCSPDPHNLQFLGCDLPRQVHCGSKS